MNISPMPPITSSKDPTQSMHLVQSSSILKVPIKTKSFQLCQGLKRKSRKTPSKVWVHYNKVDNNGICKYHGKSYKANSKMYETLT